MRKESLPIEAPCGEDWDGMIGDDRRRHCQKCDKDVLNVSAMTAQDLRRLLGRGENLCVRYAFDDSGHVELRKEATLPLIPAALLSRGRELALGASLAVSALTACNPAGPAGEAVVARAVIGEGVERLADKGTCSVSLLPVLPLEVRFLAAPCEPPPPPAPVPPGVLLGEVAPPLPRSTTPPLETPAPTAKEPAPAPCHKGRTNPEPKDPGPPTRYPHKLMGAPMRRPSKIGAP
jgi:hypothetical protein